VQNRYGSTIYCIINYKDNINIIVANPIIWLAEATNNIVQGGENDPN
jgi:hypothetical protein